MPSIKCKFCKKEIRLDSENNSKERFILCPFCDTHFENPYFIKNDS